MAAEAGKLATAVPAATAHPSGREKHGRLVQVLRAVSFALYFSVCAVGIHATQLIGAPLYWINRELYYAYMSLTKRSFGVMITTMTQWWGPTTIRISGDASVAGQIRKTEDGLVEFLFPERMIMIANHQIYTDWLYLWWVGYANVPKMHGSLYIILKESLKYIPIVGPGMMFYGFIFMSRKMAVDQPRLAHRLTKLKTKHTAPDGKKYLDPMWLLLFPEGTNASANGRKKSSTWAAKVGVKDPEHVLLPRSTGIYYCLNELKGTLDYVYDCTVAYEGVGRGKFGETIFTLSSTYIRGQPPKSVNFYWRRFRIADIPLDNQEEFDVWLRERWYEKDAFMEQYLSTGRFPESPANPLNKGQEGFLETEVRTRYPWEILQIFSVLGAFGLLLNLLLKTWNRFLSVFV
ncbi:acyltransferase-domain-containing protein [Parathielavia appendiculata]|uniref:Acyltransferase-domain-containing protein n=1 Tax=Parathielavia appendiculata TaxID=2587402 RepID=A0AAN6U7S9_9PEZI|nr:acyltransferase-domain-containing protein [Parathielavia appendiculata]